MELVRHLARARIVQFAVIGGLLFSVSTRAKKDDPQIAFSTSELAALHAAEASRKAGADPKALAAAVDERAIEDEILYREGLKRGFDRDDTIIRQRVIQRTLFLAEEMAGASEAPTEAELRAFFERTFYSASSSGHCSSPRRWRARARLRRRPNSEHSSSARVNVGRTRSASNSRSASRATEPSSAVSPCIPSGATRRPYLRQRRWIARRSPRS
jgi:hypothetical protein